MSKLTEIQQQIEKLESQAKTIREKEYDATIASILETMKAFGITVKDLQKPASKPKQNISGKIKKSKIEKPKSVKSSVEAKYRGPNGEAWSGRGLLPKWLKALVDQGQPKETFLIASPATSAESNSETRATEA